MLLYLRSDASFTAQVTKIAAFLVSAVCPAPAAFSAILRASRSVDPEISLRVIVIYFRIVVVLALTKFHMLDVQLFLLDVQRLGQLPESLCVLSFP